MRRWSAEEIEKLTAEAVEAVRDHYGAARPSQRRRDKAATLVTLVARAGTSVARVASEAGVSLRLVAMLVDDPEERGKAWQAVRHAGRREQELAEAAFRDAVLAEWERQGGKRGGKADICRRYGLHKPQLDRILATKP